ncbi:MAG: MraY family glycosyltransferase [Candidatus Paceibacterota bacterium]|jgi:UDP-GlcNAc:undecaprenyl-phosphate GlcNAc-1-phosphate transferase
MSNIALYIQPFFLALFASIALTFFVAKMSRKYDLLRMRTTSGSLERPISRFGGASMIISFLLIFSLSRELVFDVLKTGIAVSSVMILIFGIYDDLKDVSWKKQLLVQISVALIMIYSGLTVDYIANPLGGKEFRLDQFVIGDYSVLGSLFVLFWIVGFMNVMNWLDGSDGLAGGVGFIGAVTLFIISISDIVNQPPLAIMAIALAGSTLGFLIFNMHPARIFMGTSGSYFLGFMLSVLAIFSGGKIATALLIMGFPIIDAMWVMAVRMRSGNSPFTGDATHLHYRLLKRGWSQKKIAYFVYVICAVFAVAAIFFQNIGKIISLILLFVLANYLIYEFGIKGEKGKIIDTKQ